MRIKKMAGAAALSLILITTACSSGTDGNGPTSGSANQGSNTSEQTAEAPKITFGVTTAGSQYVEGSANMNEDIHVKKLREMTGIDVQLEMIPYTDYKQNITLLFAGGDMPDLLQTAGVTAPEIAPAFEADVFMPLNDLIDEHAPNLKKHIPQEAWDSPRVSSNGVIYAVPSIKASNIANVTFMRKDWLDKLDLQAPETVDEYIEVLRAFRDKDPNGNGKKDEVPYTARANFTFGEAFFGAFDVPISGWRYTDGKLMPNYVRPEMKQALELYSQLYQEKLIDNEFFVQQGKDWDAKIKGQAIAGMWTHVPEYPDKWLTEVRQADPNAEIVIVPSPKGADGKGGTGYGTDPVGGMVYMIPQGSEDPVSAIKFLDWFYTQEAMDFFAYGIEGQDHTVENGQIKYKYPVTQEETYLQSMRQYWLRFIGPDPITNEEFMKEKPNGELVLDALEVADNEGVINDGSGMPNMPTLTERPELGRNGLFLETAARIMTGEGELDEFDAFVESWMKRGGDKLIEEATAWYENK
ncbi:extracellular solute-binding protein [Paenibacillus lemnae]|uniref:Extracellular solute-binding protein n=1 Tax=Paenibacillus lemnae TaxID=1330551 RepID=A0A848M613_PAELE|nr:extracellular solute-binding protein [Paenibacillus lemnae]